MLRDRRPLVLLAAMAIVVATVAVFSLSTVEPSRGLAHFRSYADLAQFLDQGAEYPAMREAFGNFGGVALTGPPTPGASDGLAGYTGTNVQVEGVDELDFVKTDGTHLYLASGAHVIIAQAVPATDMAVVARINVSGLAPLEGNWSDANVAGLFVNSNRLAVVASFYEMGDARWEGDTLMIWEPWGTRTVVGVYDLTNVEAPALVRSYGVSGSLVSARMIFPFVYVIANEFVQMVQDVYVLPEACAGDRCEALAPTDIRYDPSSLDPGAFTNVLAANLRANESNVLSVVTGYTSTLYMSLDALYLSYLKWEAAPIALAASQISSTFTTIHKIRVANASLEALASADVPGSLLNQFSMDEHEGYLRLATTSWSDSPEGIRQLNNVYVLDLELHRVGALQGLAPNEQVHSARFLGDRAYLVTFEKIDPLFVIDLSDPTDPRVLGYLEIPGYSDYLHPYDADRILGLGKDAIPDEIGDFSWYQGLKLSLFDVADVAHPEELARFGIGDRGTDSEALHDHHAFLFLPDRGLLVIPVTLALIDPSDWGGDPPPWAYGETVWVGAYALRVSVEGGFEFAGRITHLDDPIKPMYGWDYQRTVRRSVVIDDVLYTISGSLVKANGLADLAEIGVLPYG